jgi:hypothetical protein
VKAEPHDNGQPVDLVTTLSILSAARRLGALVPGGTWTVDEGIPGLPSLALIAPDADKPVFVLKLDRFVVPNTDDDQRGHIRRAMRDMVTLLNHASDMIVVALRERLVVEGFLGMTAELQGSAEEVECLRQRLELTETRVYDLTVAQTRATALLLETQAERDRLRHALAVGGLEAMAQCPSCGAERTNGERHDDACPLMRALQAELDRRYGPPGATGGA